MVLGHPQSISSNCTLNGVNTFCFSCQILCDTTYILKWSCLGDSLINTRLITWKNTTKNKTIVNIPNQIINKKQS